MYLARLNQIREELRKAYPEEAMLRQIVQMRGDSGNEMKEFDHRMHGYTALSRIDESITDECASDGNYELDEVDVALESEGVSEQPLSKESTQVDQKLRP